MTCSRAREQANNAGCSNHTEEKLPRFAIDKKVGASEGVVGAEPQTRLAGKLLVVFIVAFSRRRK